MGQCMASLLQQEYLLNGEEEVVNCLFLLCYIGQPQELNPFNRIIFNFVNRHTTDQRFVIDFLSTLLCLLRLQPGLKLGVKMVFYNI